ncbi:serine racemase VanT catalytic subunit [Lachnospiraceae bacterium OttesenSCG-928-D06]|nr:serine racemase VanT catalytic subunit [Lachnospiraceae bacterium OttesenSCG-928-D06]
MNNRAFKEINIEHLQHNVKELQRIMKKDCKIMAVVKANAYGHGAAVIASSLNQMNINAFAVATVDEGIELRKCKIKGEILILGYSNPKRAKEIKEYDLTQTLIDYDYACSLKEENIKVKTHIKIDTGMHRLGFAVHETSYMEEVFSWDCFDITGIYTHLCVPESLLETDIIFTRQQIASFYQVLSILERKGITIPATHIQSSYGLMNYPELQCDYARIGIALYGTASSKGIKTKCTLDLKPVLSLKSPIVLIRTIKRGESVGYGRSFFAKRDTRIAILPIGYGDGLPRNLSGTLKMVMINEKMAPIVGKICMDQIAVDVTDIENVKPLDIATLIGNKEEKEPIAEEMAEYSESITNEILCRMGERLDCRLLS